MKFRCAQRGCEFEFDADLPPDDCPVCLNPFIASGQAASDEAATVDEIPWSDYSVAELQAYADDWLLCGWNLRTPKAKLIELLEAAEAE